MIREQKMKMICDFVGCGKQATCTVKVRSMEFTAMACNVHAQLDCVTHRTLIEDDDDDDAYFEGRY